MLQQYHLMDLVKLYLIHYQLKNLVINFNLKIML